VEGGMAIDLELVKALAGPVATIIASFTAVGVTAYFGGKQVQIAASQAATAESQAATAAAQKEIARSQRDIAFDKLKYDLFGKRYELFAITQRILKVVLNNTNNFMDIAEYSEMIFKMREARFFFGDVELAVLDKVVALSGELMEVTAIRKMANEPNYARALQRYPEIIKELVHIHHNLPVLLENALGFSQIKVANHPT
jgi:hypothetical protein